MAQLKNASNTKKKAGNKIKRTVTIKKSQEHTHKKKAGDTFFKKAGNKIKRRVTIIKKPVTHTQQKTVTHKKKPVTQKKPVTKATESPTHHSKSRQSGARVTVVLSGVKVYSRNTNRARRLR